MPGPITEEDTENYRLEILTELKTEISSAFEEQQHLQRFTNKKQQKIFPDRTD